MLIQAAQDSVGVTNSDNDVTDSDSEADVEDGSSLFLLHPEGQTYPDTCYALFSSTSFIATTTVKRPPYICCHVNVQSVPPDNEEDSSGEEDEFLTTADATGYTAAKSSSARFIESNFTCQCSWHGVL